MRFADPPILSRSRSDRAIAVTLTAIGLVVIASAAIVTSSADQVRYVLAALGLILILFGVSFQKRASDDIAH